MITISGDFIVENSKQREAVEAKKKAAEASWALHAEATLLYFRLRQKLREADSVMEAIDNWTEFGGLVERSQVNDARLDYGEPFKYEFSGK